MTTRRFTQALFFSLAVAAASTGCEIITKQNSPTAPSGSTSSSLKMDAFVGSWASSAVTPPSPSSCGNLQYTVTPTSASSANVTFSATCAGGLQVSGTGVGTLGASSLNWSAQGTVSQGGIACPFVFPSGSNTAVSEGAALRVNYSGTICGLPVSGSELVNKK